MKGHIADLLGRQEREDGAAARSDEAIVAAVRREFSNADELLRAAQEMRLRPSDFFAAEHFPDLPVLPRRTADRFAIRKHTASQRPYLHAQDFYELICVLHGSCTQSFAGAPPLRLRAGEAVLLAPGSVHKLARAGAEDLILKLILPPPLFDALAILPRPQEGSATLFSPSDETFRFLLLALLREQTEGDEQSERATDALLLLLFTELRRSREADPPRTDEALERYLAAHFRTASLADFAARSHYSADYAGRRIRRATGKSFSQLANEYRLRMAAKLLAETPMAVEAIAAEVGYADPSGLYKQFAALFGMTPGEYRRSFT